MAGQLLPGRTGFIYLTDVLYTLGWQATDRLGLPDKNAEVAICVAGDVLPEEPEYRGVVPELPASSGRSFRRGGGHQWTVGQPIPLRVFPWSWIDLEVP